MSALVALLWPALVAAGLFGPPRVRAWALRLAPWAALPALLPLALDASVALPWLLLGTELAVDAVNRPLLLLTAVGWSLAGWFAAAQVAERRRRFWLGWLGALSGMLLLTLAADIVGFYLGYAVLSLSAYLLVTHAASPEALRAGRVYLVMAVLGEAAVLIGVLQLAGQVGNAPLASLAGEGAALAAADARWWLLAGFAVKLGIVPLHLWLPLAHPVAPAPASAILSGIIVKAGLAGWLRFVPAFADDARWVGVALLALGLFTAFGGVALGLTQRRFKTVLAYSTISQMGLVLTAFALAFLVPGGHEAMLSVLGLLMLHHGLNKASLFVAYGVAPGSSPLRLALFVLPALALAAAPFTSGFVAKDAVKAASSLAGLGDAMTWLLALTSTATALLMWKAFRLARALDTKGVPLHPSWPLLVAAGVVVPWWYASTVGISVAVTLDTLVAALWPLALAVVVAVVAERVWARRAPLTLPEGDVVVLIERAWASGAARARRQPRPLAPPAPTPPGTGAGEWLVGVEARLRRLPVVGLGLLLIGSALWLVLRVVSGG